MAQPNPSSRPPLEQRITDLAMAEGHDADIPTNLGSLPLPSSEHHRRDTATSHSRRNTASTIDKEEKEKDFGGGGGRGSALSSTEEITSHASSRSASLTHTGDEEEATLPLEKRASRISGAAVNISSTTSEEEDEWDLGPNDVYWDGPSDPQNPMNWSTTRKWSSIALVSLITFLTPLGSSSFAPGVPQLMEEFGSDSSLLSGFVVSVYVLGFAVGPLVIAPMSEMFGRLPLYHICGTLFAVWTIACALARTLDELIVFRFFAGCFGAAPLALGGGTIADLAHADWRATAMAIWTLGPTIGPVIGPVAGGFICENLGWRWNFWIIAIAAGVVIAGSVVCMKETYAPALLARKAQRLRKETGNPLLKSRLDNGMTTKELFLYSIVRPSKMLLFSPVCLSQSLYVAIIYSYLYLMFTTVTEIFEKQYHFRSDLVGLAYVGMGLGSFIGQFGYTWFENRNYAYHQEKGDLRPEHRLIAMVPGALLLPVSLFWYGWSVQAGVHWMCPIIAMGVLGVALLLIFVSLATPF